jgi:hypothetical protein
MDLSAGSMVLLAFAGFVAGMINAAAGGGSLVSFPTLVAIGYPPLTANVTNNVAVAPGYVTGALGYRRGLSGQCCQFSPGGSLGFQDLNVGQVPIVTRVVDTVVYDERVRHLETRVLDVQISLLLDGLESRAKISKDAGLLASRNRLR